MQTDVALADRIRLCLKPMVPESGNVVALRVGA